MSASSSDMVGGHGEEEMVWELRRVWDEANNAYTDIQSHVHGMRKSTESLRPT
jgi:hypothetical protein